MSNKEKKGAYVMGEKSYLENIAEMNDEDDYFYDAGEDITMEADLDSDDNVYYDYENVDRFLEWCVSREEDERPYFEVNMNLFGEEEDE